MKSKFISTSTKKSIIITQKPNISKKPTIVKCFICNQMFYTQQTFDIHMDQHQKKVNKHLPDQIQRKTMQSFGIKRKQSMNRKNTTLEAINQNQTSEKISLSSTMKNSITLTQFTDKNISSRLKQTTYQMSKKPYPNVMQTLKMKQDRNQYKKETKSVKQVQDREIEQIDKAIQETSILMSQIAFITERTDDSNEINRITLDQSQSEQEEEMFEKIISEHDFVHMIQFQNDSIVKIEEDILKTNFRNKSLENCQIQIQYLRNLKKISPDPKSLQKINKIKSKILNQVINLIMQNLQTQKNHKKSQKIVNSSVKIQQIINLQVRNCSECLDLIGYDQKCILCDEESFHQSCFNELKK